MRTTKLIFAFSPLLAVAAFCAAEIKVQQVHDPDFKPPIEKIAYAEGKGPVVLIDEAHFNFHTATGRYQSFADLLRRDGYVVQASKEKFGKESLKAGKGRVAIFGEAAMFSAQLAGPQKLPMGMNDPIAKQNPQFLLNVMHWLSDLLK